ncbi:hypothetical protein C9374_006580 [Naegleria lovaniensis]|uniref:Peptidase M14 domain-containing protein n=1 Tax=Naegleria lovaniensis TaxID=51637 RepID=A0AA88GNC0_NAELO|nr:uncharacterized protein C9374_006580 [Naegleria lovaniensis]KAG2379463.1 hypothetical protein C9374_006580 [Naegleria lovaniensis]
MLHPSKSDDSFLQQQHKSRTNNHHHLEIQSSSSSNNIIRSKNNSHDLARTTELYDMINISSGDEDFESNGSLRENNEDHENGSNGRSSSSSSSTLSDLACTSSIPYTIENEERATANTNNKTSNVSSGHTSSLAATPRREAPTERFKDHFSLHQGSLLSSPKANQLLTSSPRNTSATPRIALSSSLGTSPRGSFRNTASVSTSFTEMSPRLSSLPAISNTEIPITSTEQHVNPITTHSSYKGNLLFDASFECGNLERIVRVDENEYDLYIRGDTNAPNKKMWFYFKVSNVYRNQKVLFTITNLSKNKSLYRQGMTPLVSSTSRPKWQRIPEKQVYYYRKPPKYERMATTGTHFLSWVFVFDNDEDEYFFAYSYPYSYTDLQKFLSFIEYQGFNYFQREVLCRTVQNRRCDILTITSPENLISDPSRRKRVVMVTARIHPGETPASYVCHGFISFIVSNHPIAQLLRDHLIFKIVPMLNPDGVAIGNYRTCSMGWDLNRHWLNPQEWSQPTIFHLRKYLLKLKNDPQYQIDFFMDLHSHSGANNGFMYVNYNNGPTFKNATTFGTFSDMEQLRYPKLLDLRAKEFSMSDTKRCKDPSKLGTSRRVLGEVLRVAKYCYTLEVSFFSFKTSSLETKLTPFTTENYQSLGKNMCLALSDFYGLSTTRSSSPFSSD